MLTSEQRRVRADERRVRVVVGVGAAMGALGVTLGCTFTGWCWIVAGYTIAVVVVELGTTDPDPVVCTGLTASWCPVHGDCTCLDNGTPGQYGNALDDPECPLHAPDSDHAEGLVDA